MSTRSGPREPITPDDEDFRRLQSFLHEQYGLHFPEKRLYSLRHKISRRLEATRQETVSEYLSYVKKAGDDEVSKLLDQVLTNRTYFYREPDFWRYFREELANQFCGRERFNVWSPACSTGEEPYTAALCLEDRRRQKRNAEDCEYRVLATDLSQSVLRQAVRGRYGDSKLESLRDHHPDWVETYFSQLGDRQWQLDDAVRRYVAFREFNLINENYPFEETFQLIICRNVLLYFDRETVGSVINSLAKSLVPGGYLAIG
ncbi:MAG: protein-glutamate O-methyltransferase CheR [bacterium]